MPAPIEIRTLKAADGSPIYRVSLGVGGGMSIVRDFKSRKEAELFANPDRKPPGKPKGASRP